jgi:diguanylate cyclase (GGDEF)-like protein
LDYLSNIKKELSDPKIIEEDKSKFVAETTTKDDLTGLYLREVFDVVLKKEVDEANRTNSPLCLLMLDIDDFKVTNDTCGHQEGDAVLTKLGAALNDSVREMDTAVRYGGEEMAIIMPKIPTEKVRNAAERIREAIEKIQFNDFSVTVSIGVSQTSNLIKTPEQLIRSADEALMRQKKRGKTK